MGLFDISAGSGLITWSQLVNDTSMTLCSWTLAVRVSDHGVDRQLWTDASLIVVVDRCDRDETVSADRHRSAADPNRLPISDWHVFVVAVAVAACVVVVGTVLTVVVALRQCRRRRRKKKKTVASLSHDGRDEEREGEVMLHLLNGPGDSLGPGCSDHQLLTMVINHLNNSNMGLHQHVSQAALLHALQHQIHPQLQVMLSSRLVLILCSNILRGEGKGATTLYRIRGTRPLQLWETCGSNTFSPSNSCDCHFFAMLDVRS